MCMYTPLRLSQLPCIDVVETSHNVHLDFSLAFAYKNVDLACFFPPKAPPPKAHRHVLLYVFHISLPVDHLRERYLPNM